jgi:hypothetical protein
MNTIAEQEKLKKNLTNYYGQYLENRQINSFVNKYPKENALDIKARAYRNAYKKYMFKLTNVGTSFVNKLPKAPRCPSGVTAYRAGGFGVDGAVSMAGRGAAAGVMRAGRGAAEGAMRVGDFIAKPFKGGGNPAKNAINRMNRLSNNNKKILKEKINKGIKPDTILRNARARARQTSR